eukprot:Sspe_Gene.39751::Locus_19163_Transcript_1_1_Confidence_1.000_Length_2428::g.39751::m.39751
MQTVVLLLLAAGVAVDAGLAKVSDGTEPIKVSSTGPDSTLPSFFFMQEDEEGGGLYTKTGYTGGLGEPRPFFPDDSCPDDLFENTMRDERVPQLPWMLQEDWGCEREPQDVSVLVQETETLRVAITPQWGGKIWSVYHKGHRRQLVFNNPAHQPDNIGYRKAWVSGGIEFNWAPGYIGHSVFTEAPVWSAVLDTKYGEVVRVWEYDRINHTVWQVDILAKDDVLWTHAKITNPNDVDLEGYWWTCVAMPITDMTRIIMPAELTCCPCTPWPSGAYTNQNTTFVGADVAGCREKGTCAWQQDMSWLGNVPSAHDFFSHIDTTKVQPFLAHVADDGYTVMHAHPLNGTKIFTWGQAGWGAFQQDFMSASDYQNPACPSDYYDPYCEAYKHEGRYTELQIGPAPTQMHTFPLPRKTTFEWTDWYQAWQADKSTMHADYATALGAAQSWLRESRPAAETREMDDFFRSIADIPPERVRTTGMPWGGLWEKATGKRLAPGVVFPPPPHTPETTPWLELLENGTFSAKTVSLTPVNFEVDPLWEGLLLRSAERFGATWLHHLFLGTIALERGNAAAARSRFEASMASKPSVHAARNLALLAANVSAGVAKYQQAWALWTKLNPSTDPNSARLGKDLASEMAGWLLAHQRWTELESLLADISAIPNARPFAKKDRVLHATAAVALRKQDHILAKAILRGNCFPTYGSERAALIELWWQANVLEATKSKGSNLTTIEIVRLRRKIGCDGDYTVAKWNSPCRRGPPNLGYPY